MGEVYQDLRKREPQWPIGVWKDNQTDLCQENIKVKLWVFFTHNINKN